MKTFNIKKEWIIWLIILIPFIYSAIIYNKLPEEVPTHWDAVGRPDDYSSKFIGAFMMPLLNVGVSFFLLLLPKIDPRKRKCGLLSGTYRALGIVICIFFTAFCFFTVP
ncbi:MAG: DUF1648 domain-containing protein, partial [Bacteroidia bacterium]